MRHARIIGLLFAAFFSQAQLFADLDSKISSFFDAFNTTANRSSADYINSQLGVHFLGGTGTVRTAVYDVSPVHINMPNVSAGCGGIDYTLGGINIASKDEMKKALKSIASSGVAYAFLLGIETVSPVVASSMKQIQTWANQLNAININSCELASGLVQGAWPKTQRASSFICEHASTASPFFQDHIEAKHGCRNDGTKRQEIVNKIRAANEDVLAGNYNIAWKALEKTDLDEETKNLFMNITGTIVVLEIPRNPTEEKKVQIYPPQFKKALELLRFGGTFEKAYKITDNQVDVSRGPIEIKIESAWKERVYKMLLSLQDKILRERKERSVGITQEEKNLINTTHFPIGSLLSLMAHYNGKGAVLALDRYSDLIALERVLKFAENVVRETLFRAESLRSAQFNGYQLDEYIKQVGEVLRELQAMNVENLQKISSEHQVIDYLINIDKNLREKERGI